MYATTKIERKLLDGDDHSGTKEVPLPPGRHELEKIPNPWGLNGFWLVLKGTKIGMGENSWHQWEEDTDDFQIIFEE